MADRQPSKTASASDDREARLKAALKQNMARRKAQAKARADRSAQADEAHEDE